MDQRQIRTNSWTAVTSQPCAASTRRLHRQGWLALLILVLVPGLAMASVTAQVDRTTINEGDTFTLTLNVTGDNHAQPDLSALQHDFDVLGTGQKSMIQIINGTISSNRSWTITLSPKRSGKLRIPPVSVGSDRSNALDITVLPASASSSGGTSQADVFLQVSVKPAHQSYVQAQLIYTVRLYYAEPLRQGTLSEPSVDNAIVQKLGKDSNFSTLHGGRQYQVIERRYAIFPQHSGQLAIPGVVFDGQVDDPSAQTGDAFFDSFNPATRHVHLRSRALDLQVASQPASYQGNNWLPAQDIQLQEKWSPGNPAFRVGEPVTRSIIIHARGLASSQLPDLPMPQQAGLKLYPDQAQTTDKADSNTLEATREQKIAMIPTHAGDITLPAIHLTWWDTGTRRQRTTSLPAETIHVLPAIASDNSTAPGNTTNAATVPADANAGASGAATARPSEPATRNMAITRRVKPQKAEFIWMTLAILFACAWLVTTFLWWRNRQTRTVKPKSRNATLQHSHSHSHSQPPSIKPIQQACHQHDPRAVKHALLDWARATWRDNPPLSLGAMARRLDDEALRMQISALDKMLYTQNSQPWRADDLLAHFTAYLKHPRPDATASNDNDLASLFLHRTHVT